MSNINELQLKAFPNYDNVKQFVELLEFLKAYGYTDTSHKNDEWPSMTNDKYAIHVSYTAESEYNDADEFCVGVFALDGEGTMSNRGKSFDDVAKMLYYIGFDKVPFAPPLPSPLVAVLEQIEKILYRETSCISKEDVPLLMEAFKKQLVIK